MTYFFYHIPKTAGTSFKRVLEVWFQTARDEDMSEADRKRIATIRPENLCIHGHFGASLKNNAASLIERYPFIVASPDARVMTLLRDPIDHAISYYFHEKRRGKVLPELNQFLSKPLPVSFSAALDVGRSEEIDAMFSSFWFVGAGDDLQPVVDKLAEREDLPTVTLPIQNQGLRDSVEELLTPSERRAFEKLMALDYEIWERARDLCAAGPSQWAPLEQFNYIGLKRVPIAEGLVTSTENRHPAGWLVRAYSHGRNGEPRAVFDCREPVGITLEYEVLRGPVDVEPAFVLRRNGSTVFSAAFTPDPDLPALPAKGGHRRATAWIPGNLLNPGYFEIDGSLCTPFPLVRHDKTLQPIRILIEEEADAAGTARGRWRSPFPGALRPKLAWKVE